MTDGQKAKDCQVKQGGREKSTISPPMLDSTHKSTSAQEPKREEEEEGEGEEKPLQQKSPGGRGTRGRWGMATLRC